jgi:hypothetical protein
MATYLLLWNPKRWPIANLVGDLFERRGGSLYASWSSGRCKSIVAGDRLFLAHVGEHPRGIFASGVGLSSPRSGRHWNPVLARAQKKALYVKGRFDVALDPRADQIVTFEELVAAGAEFNWSQQASGVEISVQAARVLETVWAERAGSFVSMPVVEHSALEGLRTETVTYRRGRSGKLRDVALLAARGICEACDRDFSCLLEGRGMRVLQVHHRKQLAVIDKPVLNRARDLAVLCANCHMLIHMNPRRALKVEVLRDLLAREAGRLTRD